MNTRVVARLPNAAERAVAAPKMSQKGKWTAAALEAAAIEKAALREHVRNALEYARENEVGARRAITLAKKHNLAWEQHVSYQVLNNALKGRLKWPNERLWHDILTDTEETRLEEWLLASAKNDAAAKEQQCNGLKEASAKVVQLLKARWSYNKSKKHSQKSGCVPLTEAEKRRLSKKFGVRESAALRPSDLGVE